LLGTIVLGVGVYLLHEAQVKRSARTLLLQAGKAEGRGEPAKSLDYLERYLNYEPDDVKALAKYGELLAVAPKPKVRLRALDAFARVLRAEPEDRAIRRRLVDVAMGVGVYKEAETHLKEMLKSTPDDGELKDLVGQCEEGQADFREAARWYAEAIGWDDQAKQVVEAKGGDPGRVEAYVHLAAVKRDRLNRPEDADGVMDELVKHNDRSARAYLERGRYRRRAGQKGGAEDVAKALELAPDDPDVILAAAETAQDQGELARARELLGRGRERAPRDERFYRALAAVESGAGQVDEALSWLDRGLKEFPGSAELLWLRANLLVQAGRAQAAAEAIQGLRAAAFPPELANYLEAALFVQDGPRDPARFAEAGGWPEAARRLEAAAVALADSERPQWADLAKRAYLLLGRCYEQLGNPDQRSTAYRRAVDLARPGDPLDVPARLGLAEALAAMNRLDDAIEEYRQAVGRPGAPAEVRIALARLMILRKLALPPERRRWDDVEAALDAAARALPGAPEVAMLRAEVLAAQGGLDAARDLVRRQRDRDPGQAASWVALADLARRQGRPDEALKVLDEAEAKLGGRPELRLARVRHWAAVGGAEAVAALDRLARDADRRPPAEGRRLRAALVDAYAQAGEPARAAELAEALAAEQPRDLLPQMALFDAAARADDAALMERALEAIRRVEGEGGALWRYARAGLLLRRARAEAAKAQADGRSDQVARAQAQVAGLLDEAAALLQQAAKQRPDWDRPHAALGEVADLRGGEAGLALEEYDNAIKLGDLSPTTIRRAVQLLYGRKDYLRADQLLRKLQADAPLSGDLQRLAADAALRARDPERALALARQAVPADATAARDQLWLGQIAWAAAQAAQAAGDAAARGQEAERALRRAVALAPKEAGPRVVLVQFLALTGQARAAEAETVAARGALPKAEAPLALARCYEAIGDVKRAEAAYREAMAARPEDPDALQGLARLLVRAGQMGDAEAVLGTLLGLKGPAAAEAVAWAKRVKSGLLSATGDYQKSREALELLQAGSQAPGGAPAVAATPEDRRATALVFAKRPNLADRREAIAILEGMVADRSDQPQDLALLANLCDLVGDWPKARDYLQQLLGADKNNPAYLAPLARGLVAHGERAEAEVWLDRLEQLQPKAPGTVEIRARLLVAQGRAPEAVARLEGLVKERPDQLAAAAALLEDLRQPEAAKAMYRALAARQKEPGPKRAATLILAEFLGRRGRPREGIDLVERAWRERPGVGDAGAIAAAEAIATAGVAVLVAAEADAAQARRVEAILDEALKAHPDQITFRFDLANLRSLQGRPKDAEAIYREIYERDKTKGAPLNNLAWLLALQEGRGSEALDLINESIKLDGPDPHRLDTRALAYLALGRPDDAVKDLEGAVAVAPSADAYFHLAQAHLKAGRRPEAVEAFRKAKDAGLRAETLHPLERDAYRRLNGDLGPDLAANGPA
jgi:tetratricopeptide (TPR) repeat protein